MCNVTLTTNGFIHAKSLSSKNIDPIVIGATPKNPIFHKNVGLKNILFETDTDAIKRKNCLFILLFKFKKSRE
jgi:hypothetical protein